MSAAARTISVTVAGTVCAASIVASLAWVIKVERYMADDQEETHNALSERLERLEDQLYPLMVEFEVQRRLGLTVAVAEESEAAPLPPPSGVRETYRESKAEVDDWIMEQRALPDK